MSVQLILSHPQVVLDHYNHATLTLKAIFATLPPNIFALYKVRTNAKDTVDVRPSFGVLHSQQEDSTVATMQIRYLGNVEAIKKMKLQVSWVWGEGIPQKKPSHVEFSQLYATLRQKIGTQKTHMLEFTTQKQAQKTQGGIATGQKAREQEASGSETGLEGEKEVEEPLETIQNEVGQGSKAGRKSGRGRFWIALAILVAFLLGMLVGLKLQKQKGVLSQLKSMETPTEQLSQYSLQTVEMVPITVRQIEQFAEEEEPQQVGEMSQAQEQTYQPSTTQELAL